MINIYDYISYRGFIKDYYLDQKKKDSKFSYRSFADRAGFKTKTFIPKVINGEKKLGQRSMFMLVKAMKLNKRESSYFEAMIAFNDERNFEKMVPLFYLVQKLSTKSDKSVRRENAFYCYGEWYHRVLYELIPIFDWKDDFEVLAKSVNPPITPNQAKKAVKRLEESGFIERDSSGKYVKTLNTIFIESPLMELAGRILMKQMLEKGTRAFRKSYNEQGLVMLTTKVSFEELEQIKREIETFNNKIIEIVNKDSLKEQVIQLNIQLFPVAKPKKI